MATYGYQCPNEHYWELISSWAKRKSRSKCEACGKFGSQVYHPPKVSGPFSDKTRELLAVPFGRKKAMGFKTGKDVDRALADFDRRYKHFGLEPSHPDKDIT